MYKAMKIKYLKNYGIPSYILNIWEKHYSPYLLPLQEDAVRNYGILNCGENEIHPHPTLSPQGRGNKEERMLYTPTEEMDSRFRGNDIRRSGNGKKDAPHNDREGVRLCEN